MVQPQSVTLLPGGRQQFSQPNAQAWTISPKLGVINPTTGIYHAPPNVWLSRGVDVIAIADGQEIGRASVTISSARNWMIVLGLFWAALSLAVLITLFSIWPPPAAPPSVAVYPPVVTLQVNDTLQFLSSANGSGANTVSWTAGEGQITPPGVFTAPPPAAKQSPIAVTVTRDSDRTQTATAQVYIHANKLVMDRSVVDAAAMPSGTPIQFHAVGPGGAENGLRWYLSGPGSLSNSGVYTVREKYAPRAVITAVDPNTAGRQTAAVVKLASDRRMDDLPLLWLVAVMGAFGALLGAMRSFVNYVGNRTFIPSWGFYYFSRPVFGAGLALIVFFAYRIGAISGPQGGVPADPSTAAFVAGVVGLFADTFLQKLQELVNQLFQPADSRSDKMGGSSPAPAVTGLALDQGNLIVTGTNLAAGATVSVNGTGLQPSVVNSTKLTVTLLPAMLVKGTKLDVAVTNADGGKSAVMSVTA